MKWSKPPKLERRTKSELFREMWRVYCRYRVQRDRDEDRWVMNLVAEAAAEQKRNPMTAEARRAEDQRLARYGSQQSQALGIKAGDTDRLIHERRKARKA
jgi:hypothetical protein